MRWQKRGIVVEAPPPVAWAVSHAALPVLGPDDGDRRPLYFSTRDSNGRSQIARAYIELDHEAAAVAFDSQVILGPGKLGTFDDSGVTTSCLVSRGGRQYQYYSGWTLGSTVPFYFYVGCAVSDDGGRTFHRASQAPILERSDVDPYLTASPWILVEDGLWRMWYVSGTEWFLHEGTPRHRYHIKYAESQDGIDWRRDGHICIDYRDDDEYAIARPCVVKDGDVYRMWYSSRGAAYRIGYAESPDGLRWTRQDEDAGIDVSPSGWDSEMVAYPLVFDHRGVRYMLYNGNGYGSTGIGLAVLEGADAGGWRSTSRTEHGALSVTAPGRSPAPGTPPRGSAGPVRRTSS